MANRYDQVAAPARFSPLTMEEQSFAPLALRAREDSMMNSQDEITHELNNIEVLDKYQDEVNKERTAIQEEMKAFADKIQKEGVGDINTVHEFRNLRNKYNSAVSATGNIGRASAAKTEVDAMADAYLQDALTKGQSAERALVKFEEEKTKYLDGLPSELSKFKGSLPGFTPAFAPQKQDSFEVLNKIAEAATGIDKTKTGDFHFVEQKDEETGEVLGYTVVSDSGDADLNEEINNNAAIAKIKLYMEKYLLDPSSNINKDLVWNGRNANELLDDAMVLADAKLKRSTVDEDKHGGTVNFGGGTKGKNKVAPLKATIPPGEATLQSHTSGMRKLVNSTDSTDLEKQIKETTDSDTLTAKERTGKLNELNHALLYKMKLESEDKFVKTMDPLVANDKFFSGLGIETYEELLDYVDSDEATATHLLELQNEKVLSEEKVGDIYRKATADDISLQEAADKILGKHDPSLNEASGTATGGGKRDMSPAERLYLKDSSLRMKKNVWSNQYDTLSNELLTPSILYGVGFSEADTKFSEALSKGMSNQSLVNLQNQGLMTIADDDGYFPIGDIKAANETSTDGGKQFKNFNSDLENANKVTWGLTGINDGGISGDSQLVFDVTADYGEGNNKTFSVAVDLDPEKISNITEQILNPNGSFYKLLDQKSRYVLDGIRDKNRYSDVATDLQMNIDKAAEEGRPFEAYDEIGTATIKANSLQALDDQNIRHKSNKSALAKYLFVDPYDETSDYLVAINKDHSYSMYKKGADDIEIPMTFNDYSKKEMGMLAQQQSKIGMMSDVELEAEWLEAGKYATIMDLWDANPNLQTTANSVMYSDSPKFLKGLNEFNDLIDTLLPEERNHPDTIKKAAAIFDKHLANLPIKSRQFKLIL